MSFAYMACLNPDDMFKSFRFPSGIILLSMSTCRSNRSLVAPDGSSW